MQETSELQERNANTRKKELQEPNDMHTMRDRHMTRRLESHPLWAPPFETRQSVYPGNALLKFPGQGADIT